MSENRQDFRNHILGIDTEASVVLATKSISLEDVLKLTTGAMIPFEKGHDLPLTLRIGGRDIASGEAVKVGDKFGMRVRQVLDGEGEQE